ncbi:ribosomal RNA processing protein 36 homolog isoform X1 [Cylas formicarius]|uniref:ribosomal RNA processing protein 36 homolog isoform X1 n=1 Tax=Cylas formicarius TaxID=197179 RepID=UPI0029585C0F|nr:ribosomal RNA processing protein 36 homolog isoform X1 [Cylas formicarius]
MFDDCDENKERVKIRENLKSLSFEELIKLKETVGSKMYNKAVFRSTNTEFPKSLIKRANKNRPREVSSKTKASKLSLALPVPFKKNIPRDPRFDPLCGSYDKKLFNSNYQFIQNIRQKERHTLQKEYNECVDSEKKRKIKLLIQRLDNQIGEQEKIDRQNHNKSEKKLEIREQLKRGKKPVFKSKSVKKIENLVEKYEELKKNNKLQKHIEKRSKKLSAKNRKKLIEMV